MCFNGGGTDQAAPALTNNYIDQLRLTVAKYGPIER
jgi:hypothetical protein